MTIIHKTISNECAEKMQMLKLKWHLKNTVEVIERAVEEAYDRLKSEVK